jgi:outer membrane receptor protein involved in Fe transport
VFGSVTDTLNTDQSGWYAQGVWQFMPRWRVGYRYDRLDFGTVTNGIVNNGLGPVAADFPVLADHSPSRNTGMIDWSPSEFSRLRVQYTSDKSRIGVTDNQIIVQYIMSLGAHGAHKF